MVMFYTTKQEALNQCGEHEQPVWNEWEGAYHIVPKVTVQTRKKEPVYHPEPRQEYVPVNELNNHRRQGRARNDFDDKPLIKFLKHELRIPTWGVLVIIGLTIAMTIMAGK